MTSKIDIINWGLIDYQTALDKQLVLVKQRQQDEIPDTLIFCTHPPVVTLGRATQASDLTDWSGSTVEVSRGGRATYHGPNQEVIYPILDLTLARQNLPPRDLHKYLSVLELCLIEALRFFDIQAQDSKHVGEDSALSKTGVWVGDKKIASIGIAVTRWVSYHGIAVNLEEDAGAFAGLNPCGFTASTMVSVEKVLGRKIARNDFREQFALTLKRNLAPLRA